MNILVYDDDDCHNISASVHFQVKVRDFCNYWS